jgi:hypothetical protein
VNLSVMMIRSIIMSSAGDDIAARNISGITEPPPTRSKLVRADRDAVTPIQKIPDITLSPATARIYLITCQEYLIRGCGYAKVEVRVDLRVLGGLINRPVLVFCGSKAVRRTGLPNGSQSMTTPWRK